jgi:hypothetical protein
MTSDPDQSTSVLPHPEVSFTLLHSLTTPIWQITALAFGHAGHLYAGSGKILVYLLFNRVCDCQLNR